MDRKEMAVFPEIGSPHGKTDITLVPQKPEEEAMLRKIPYLFERSGSHWFISFDRMKDLKREDLLILRGKDVEGVFTSPSLLFSFWLSILD